MSGTKLHKVLELWPKLKQSDKKTVGRFVGSAFAISTPFAGLYFWTENRRIDLQTHESETRRIESKNLLEQQRLQLQVLRLNGDLQIKNSIRGQIMENVLSSSTRDPSTHPSSKTYPTAPSPGDDDGPSDNEAPPLCERNPYEPGIRRKAFHSSPLGWLGPGKPPAPEESANENESA